MVSPLRTLKTWIIIIVSLCIVLLIVVFVLNVLLILIPIAILLIVVGFLWRKFHAAVGPRSAQQRAAQQKPNVLDAEYKVKK